MRRTLKLVAIVACAAATAPVAGQDKSMSFFVSSTGSGMGGNLGGLAGAAGAGTVNGVDLNRVAPDGSNINPVALSLLNVKLANGNYMIPSPQTSAAGVNYTASIPARYTETQFTLNIDHQFSSKQKLGMRVFGANVPQT